jgi:hypothetical protein
MFHNAIGSYVYFARFRRVLRLCARAGFLVMLPLLALGQTDKPAYNVIFLDFGGDVFSPQHSTPSQAAAPCANEVVSQIGKPCNEALSSVPGFSIGMGVRPIRYLQVDAFGADILGNFNGFGHKQQTFQCVSGCTGSTVLTVGSVHGLLRTGARGVLPLWHDRLLISAGAGWAWLETFERAQPSASNQQVVGCSGNGVGCLSASGSGPTEIVEVMYLPNPHIGIGVHFRNVQISSSGLDANGLYSHVNFGTTYKDRFSQVGAEISLRLGTRH